MTLVNTNEERKLTLISFMYCAGGRALCSRKAPCVCEVKGKFDILKEADGKEQAQASPRADSFPPQYLRSDKFRASYLYEGFRSAINADTSSSPVGLGCCTCVCVLHVACLS